VLTCRKYCLLILRKGLITLFSSRNKGTLGIFLVKDFGYPKRDNERSLFSVIDWKDQTSSLHHFTPINRGSVQCQPHPKLEGGCLFDPPKGIKSAENQHGSNKSLETPSSNSCNLHVQCPTRYVSPDVEDPSSHETCRSGQSTLCGASVPLKLSTNKL